jgi:hypothetical protein
MAWVLRTRRYQGPVDGSGRRRWLCERCEELSWLHVSRPVVVEVLRELEMQGERFTVAVSTSLNVERYRRNLARRQRLRCCGRWCYWRLPVGPWACTQCPRRFAGPMPRSAGPRLLDYAAEQLAKARPWTMDDVCFVRRCFGRELA